MFLLIVIYAIFISLGLPDSIFGVSWPVIHNEFAVAESFGSVYSIVVGICTGSVSFVAGYFLRKFGTAKVSIFSIFLTIIGLVGMSCANGMFMLILFAVILGLGAGAIDTGLNNFVSLHYKASHMSFLHGFWGIGVTLSPMIMSAFLGGSTGLWRNGYRTIAVIQSFICLFAIISLKKWLEKEETLTENLPIDDKSNEKLKMKNFKGIYAGILSLGFYCSMEFLVGTWGATYLVNVHALEPSAAARWISLYYGGIMLSRICSGFVSNKLGDEKMIKYGICISLIGVILLLLPIGKISYFGLLPLGFGFGPIFPSVIHSVPFRFGKKFSADLTGFHMGGTYAVGFSVQLAFGFIASKTTFKLLPIVLICFVCLLFISNTVASKKSLLNKNNI